MIEIYSKLLAVIPFYPNPGMPRKQKKQPGGAASSRLLPLPAC
ncbi:hypothetical protein [Paenibacillus herberti]|nr:hypothetical protein [Paenibacillus herberti]